MHYCNVNISVPQPLIAFDQHASFLYESTRAGRDRVPESVRVAVYKARRTVPEPPAAAVLLCTDIGGQVVIVVGSAEHHPDGVVVSLS